MTLRKSIFLDLSTATLFYGEYNVDVYVNGQWFGKRRMIFKALDPNQNAVTCFTGMNLLEYGVKQEILTKHAPFKKKIIVVIKLKNG